MGGSIDFEIEKLDKALCEEEVKDFHERGGANYRYLERIGRRMMITNEYDPRLVYLILLELHRNVVLADVSKEKLKSISDKAKNQKPEKIARKLLSYSERDLQNIGNVLDERDNYLLDKQGKDRVTLERDLESLDREECRDKITNFHKRGRSKARSLENIGRRMIITDHHDPRVVYLMISILYEEDLYEQIDKDALKSIAEDAREDDLKTTYEKLKAELGEEFLNNQLRSLLDRKHKESEVEDKFRQIEFPSNFESEKEELERKIGELDEKDRNEIEKVEEQLDEIQSKIDNSEYRYIDPFVEKYGRGNPEAREKLLKTINRQIDENFTIEELNEKIEKEVRDLEIEAVESVFELAKKDVFDDKIKYFVKVFGTGNSRVIKRGSEVLEIDKAEFSEKVEKKYREMQEELELHEFQSNLGLDTKGEIKDFRISRNEIENLKYPEVIEELRQQNISWQKIESMSGLKFEEFVEELFNSMDYDAWETKSSGDQGADVIAEKVGEKVAIQAKNKNSKTSNSAIQEVRAAIDHYNCTKGVVVSTSEYTKSAKELAESNEIELWSREEIMNRKSNYIDNNQLK